MVSKVSGNSGTNANIYMPTKDQLAKAYRSEVDQAMKNGTAKKLKEAPKGIEKYQSVDITPKGELGVHQQVYAFKGELYLKTNVLSPTNPTTWTKIGPAPMF